MLRVWAVFFMDRKFKPWETAALLALCLSAVEGEKLQSVMSREDYGIITGKEGYLLRFRIVELWGEIMNCIEP